MSSDKITVNKVRLFVYFNRQKNLLMRRETKLNDRFNRKKNISSFEDENNLYTKSIERIRE